MPRAIWLLVHGVLMDGPPHGVRAPAAHGRRRGPAAGGARGAGLAAQWARPARQHHLRWGMRRAFVLDSTLCAPTFCCVTQHARQHHIRWGTRRVLGHTACTPALYARRHAARVGARGPWGAGCRAGSSVAQHAARTGHAARAHLLARRPLTSMIDRSSRLLSRLLRLCMASSTRPPALSLAPRAPGPPAPPAPCPAASPTATPHRGALLRLSWAPGALMRLLGGWRLPGPWIRPGAHARWGTEAAAWGTGAACGACKHHREEPAKQYMWLRSCCSSNLLPGAHLAACCGAQAPSIAGSPPSARG